MSTKAKEIRAKSQELREAQKRKENRARLVIYTVVGLLVLATISAVIWVVVSQGKDKSQPGASVAPTDVTSFLVSADGVGKAKEGSVEVTEYFDYSCHACADVDVLIKDKMQEGIDAGKISVRYVPVDVVNMAWHPAAARAARIVYEDDPDHFVAFHHGMLESFSKLFQQGKAQVVTDPSASAAEITQIAARVGVPEDVVNKFDKADPSVWLKTNTNVWQELPLVGRDKLATPEFAVNGKSVRLQQEDVADPARRFVKEAQ